MGILLRLGFACPLAVPISCVLITNVSTTSKLVSPPHFALPVNHPVNDATGNCSMISFGASSKLLRSLSSGAGGDIVVVTLNIGFSVASTKICPQTVSNGTIAAASGTSLDVSDGAAAVGSLDKFIVATGAAGISADPVSLVCDAGPSTGSVASESGSAPSPASEFGLGATIGAAVGGFFLCVLLLLLFVLLARRRRSRKEKASNNLELIVFGGSGGSGVGGGHGGTVSNPVLQPRVRRQEDQETRAADLLSLRFAANRGLSRRIKNEFGAMPAVVIPDDGPGIADEEAMSTAASILLSLSPMGGRIAGSRAPSVDSAVATGIQTPLSLGAAATVLAPRGGATTPRASHSARFIGKPLAPSRHAAGASPVSGSLRAVVRSSPVVAAGMSRTVTVDADGQISPMFNEIGAGRESFSRDAGRGLSPTALRGSSKTPEAVSARAANSLAAMQVYSAPIKPILRRTVVLGSSTRSVGASGSRASAQNREYTVPVSGATAVSEMQSNPLMRRGVTQSSNRRLAVLGSTSPHAARDGRQVDRVTRTMPS